MIGQVTNNLFDLYLHIRDCNDPKLIAESIAAGSLTAHKI
jgi:hypothetical protein